MQQITKKNEITDVSKYFTDPSTEITMSTERKKVSLSRMYVLFCIVLHICWFCCYLLRKCIFLLVYIGN